jgi:transcriptional regulator with XRE-family HTH domain
MPIVLPGPEAVAHLERARAALHLSQDELAQALGVSRRTVLRWTAGQSRPTAAHLQDLARMVHPVDARLAELLATEGGVTLASLGLVPPAPPPVAAPPPPPEPPAPPQRPFPPVRLMLKAILYAAEDAAKGAPGDVRAVVAAAFAISRGLGLTVDEVDDALAGREEAPPAPPPHAEDEPRKAAGAGAPARKRDAR